MDILNLNSHLILEPPHINDPSYETVELLTTTTVTVNGSKQRVSAVTYDDLGVSPQSNVAQNRTSEAQSATPITSTARQNPSRARASLKTCITPTGRTRSYTTDP